MASIFYIKNRYKFYIPIIFIIYHNFFNIKIKILLTFFYKTIKSKIISDNFFMVDFKQCGYFFNVTILKINTIITYFTFGKTKLSYDIYL